MEWVVKHLVEQNVEAADTEAAFEEAVRQCYPEEVTIGWIKFGLSKQAVLGRLREAGVHGGKGRGRADDNFRFPNPIYGKKVSQGRFEANLVEMKTVRVVIKLRDRQVWSFGKIADELNRRGQRNRKGSKWHRVSTRHVHKNWTGKV